MGVHGETNSRTTRRFRKVVQENMKLFSLIAIAAADPGADAPTGDEDNTPGPCTFEASALSCAPNSLNLKVPFCAYTSANVDVADVFIGGDNDDNKVDACAGTIVDVNGVAPGDNGYTGEADKVVYDITADQCGITNANTADDIVYSGKLFAKSGTANEVISREKLINMPLKCEFDRSVDVSVDQFFTPLVSSVQVELSTVESEFAVGMELFSDSNYSNALNAENTISVPDPIYAKVTLDVTDNLVLQIKKCYASPTANGDGEKVYEFIDNYQALEANDMALTNNCEGTTAKFWINSFAFVNTDDAETQENVYLHCDVHVCDADNDDSCTAACDADTAEGTVGTADGTDGTAADGTDGTAADGTGVPGDDGGDDPTPGRRRRAVAPERPNATLRIGPINISNLHHNF